MAQLDKGAFENRYSNSGTGLFKTNTSNDIGSDDMRDLIDYLCDSFMSISDNFIDEDSFASDSATKVPSQQSTKAYVDATAGGIANTDLRFFESEDWVFTTLSNMGGGWTTSTTGGAALSSTGYGEDTTEHAFGTIGLTTGTGTSDRGQLYKSGGFRLGIGHTIKLRMRMAIEALSNGTDTYTVWWGLTDGIASGDPTNGVFFRYTHSVNSGKFQKVTRAAGVETAADTTVTSDTTYKIFEIRIDDAASSITFWIDSVQVGTAHTTNIPSTATSMLLFMKIEKSAGTTARRVDIDWHDLLVTRSAAR